MSYVVRNGKLQNKGAVYGSMTPREAVRARSNGATFGAMSDAEVSRLNQKKKKKNDPYAALKQKRAEGKATRREMEMLERMK